jgi:hypothetical protein
MLTQPIVTGVPLAAPAVPPTYCWKSVTPPVAPLPADAGAEEAADAELAGALAGAELAGAELELELELELQAAAPITRQAPTAATCHREPTLIRRDIPAKRTIAPCRLSAVTSEPSTFCPPADDWAGGPAAERRGNISVPAPAPHGAAAAAAALGIDRPIN